MFTDECTNEAITRQGHGFYITHIIGNKETHALMTEEPVPTSENKQLTFLVMQSL